MLVKVLCEEWNTTSDFVWATPKQNGRVERKHRHILDVSRSFLFQANLPMKFWRESLLTAAHVINRTPSSVLKGKTPYEFLYGQPPSYDAVRIFGFLCFAHLASRDKDKFGERSRKCIFVGYPYGKKGWKLYDIEINEFFISRDVVFDESSYMYIASNIKETEVDSDSNTLPIPLKDFVDDAKLEEETAPAIVNQTVHETKPATVPEQPETVPE